MPDLCQAYLHLSRLLTGCLFKGQLDVPFVTEDQVSSPHLHLSTASVQPNFMPSTEILCSFGNSLGENTSFAQTP
jgi:hypothetical protein